MKMHSDQLHVDSTVVTRLIADQFPEWRDEAVIELSVGGTVNDDLPRGKRAVRRFPLRAGNSDAVARQLEEEARASADLSIGVPLQPRRRSRSAARDRLPVAVVGADLDSRARGNAERARRSHAFAEDLASLIRALRGADTEGRRFTGSGRGGVLADHDEWMQTCFRESEALLDTPRLRRLWAELRELPAAGADVMSHRRPDTANLLVESGRLVGVLDGGGFGPADPALDLVSGWHLLTPVPARPCVVRWNANRSSGCAARRGHSSRPWGCLVLPRDQTRHERARPQHAGSDTRRFRPTRSVILSVDENMSHR